MLTLATSERPGKPVIRLVTLFAVTASVVLLGIWFWSRVCRFPAIPWNDIRLAPTIALSQGLQVYPTAAEGTIGTWMYGPLPLLFFWPASWASNAGGALMIAALLNVALTVVPITWVTFAWPATDREQDSRLARWAALLLCLALWPELHYSVHFSDNLAVALGLVGNLFLIRARGSAGIWIAASAATAAVACKQIALGIPLAQIVWLTATEGRGGAARHAWRCVVTGAVIALLSVWVFGLRGLWFTLVEIPGGIGWAPDPSDRIRQILPALALQIGVPAIVMLIARAIFSRKPGKLAAIAWACTLPLGIAGLMKLGGWTNSIHSFVLWLPPALIGLLTSGSLRCFAPAAPLLCGIAVVSVVTFRIVNESELTLRPQTAAYREADQLVAEHPGRFWFPLNPLVTLYREGRYYHDEDGLYVRRSAKKPVSDAQRAAHLPPAMEAMVFRYGIQDWGIARAMFPTYAQNTDLPHWTIWGEIRYLPPTTMNKTP